MSNSFIRAKKSRDIEFTTNQTDRPLIVQFAANNSNDFATAAEFVRNFSDGVELNCGCPQKWAIQEGLGSALIENNSLICEMVKETRKRLNYDKGFTVAVKIRLHHNIKFVLNPYFSIYFSFLKYLTPVFFYIAICKSLI
jgi:tRNA-dihydrouridine synthase 4